MKDNKRNITSVIEQEHNYLNNILDPEQFKEFKELTSELRDTWTKNKFLELKQKQDFQCYKIIIILLWLLNIGNVLQNKMFF